MLSKFRCLFFILLISSHVIAQNQIENAFRGVWIATVFNIDWPSSGSDNVERQKEDYRKLLDYYEQLNFNSVVVQVRTAGDALYHTSLAPFSRFLSAKEGKRGVWKDDPLVFMINEAHKRGMDFHAWINPFRVTTGSDTGMLDSNHIYFTQPDWIIKYGRRFYLDPGLPEVRQHIFKIVDEVVNSYDIDGIHMDDYFYPYKISGQNFNDSISFEKYGKDFDNVYSWRRANIDTLIANLSSMIRNSKPWVRFGISPFGVWRNKKDDPAGSNTEAGQTNYDDLYCDPLVWAENQWIDYLAPQLYWSRSFTKASYDTLNYWWSKNIKNIDLYIGMGTYKIKNDRDSAWFQTNEIIDQLSINRLNDEVDGEIFYNASSLITHREVAQKIKESYYAEKAVSFVGLRPTETKRIQSSEFKKLKLSTKRLKGKLSKSSLAKQVLMYTEKEGKSTLLSVLWVNDRKINTENTAIWAGENQLKFVAMDVYRNYGKEIVTMKKRNNKKWIVEN